MNRHLSVGQYYFREYFDVFLRNLIIALGVFVFLVSCESRDDEAKKEKPSPLVGPAGAVAAIEVKPAWDGSLVIDLDSIARSSIADLEEWGGEYKTEVHEDTGDDLNWKLPDGSVLCVDKDIEFRGDYRSGDMVVLSLSSWSYKSGYEALAACGYTADKWGIALARPQKTELSYRKETQISSEYRVSRQGSNYIVEVTETPSGYIVRACIKYIY